MAKTYAAELLLKNKDLIRSLDQSINKAKELKKEFSKPIEINAKIGSSFKNVQSNINRIAPKSKTIKIEATENVTKTMNNVSRNMFEMSNKMNSTINSTMKGFNSRLSASLPKLQAMSNTMAAVANTSSLMRAASGASALAGAGAGLVGAAVISRNRRGSSSNNGTDTQSHVRIIDRLKAMGAKIKDTAISLGKKFSGGFADAMSSGSKKIGSIVQRWGNVDIDSNGIFADIGGRLGQMIEKQKDKLYELGAVNPLKNWKATPGDMGFFREWQGATTQALAQGKQVFKEMGQNAKENLGAAANWVKNKWNSNIFVQAFQGGKAVFRELKQNAISNLSPITNKIKQMAYSFKFACDRGRYFFTYFATSAGKKVVQLASNIKSKLSTAFNSVKSAASRVASHIPQPIKNALSKVASFAKNTASKFKSAFVSAASAAGSGIVKGLSGAFSKVFSMATRIAKGIALAFAGAMAFGVKDMATEEQQRTSMAHFISVDDAKRNGTNTITIDQAADRANGLFDWGNEFANRTPFQNADVSKTLQRMTQVFGYGEDGSQIKDMTKLVGDMAALNPGKSMSDAAEAIADLALGETERMKEFGFKISQDELKALAGSEGQTESLSQEQIMKAFSKMTSSGGALFETFDGGADALADTMAGKFSTVMGKFRDMMKNAMKPFQDTFKGTLDKVINFLSGDFRGQFIAEFQTIADFTGDLMAGDAYNFPIIDNLLNAVNTLKDTVVPVFDTIKEQFGLVFDSASESFGGIGGIIEGTAGFIGSIITGLTPILELLAPVFNFLKETAIAVWPVIQGVIEVASQMIQDAVGFLTPIFDAFIQVMQVIGDSVAEIWPGIQQTIMDVWEKLQPVFELFGSLAQLVADIFSVLWPPISGIIERLWGIIGPIFEGMADILGWIAELCTKVVDGIGGSINAVKDSKWNPFNWFGGDDAGKQNAYGQERVPYDGYKASLHEGERILTSRQAAQMDAGLLGGGGTTTNTISINVNGSGDPDTTVRLVVEKLKETLENTSVKSFA